MLFVLAAAATDPPETVGDAAAVIVDSADALWEGFISHLPLIGVGLVVLLVGWFLARWFGGWAHRGTTRAGGDRVVAGLAERLTRVAVLIAALLLALSIAGVSVGAALAGLGIAGLAVALALQPILENFVAGLLLILRKPFVAGDQIIVGDYEGTVTDIDLRITRIQDYDGEMVILPNSDVFKSAMVNLTHAPTRRSAIEVGIDYRDDHDAAADVIVAGIRGVEGVLSDPPPRAICTALGESSVNFTVQFWTDSRRASVVAATDKVLRATKTALDTNGFTIPWPIRTLVVDDLQDNVIEHRGVGD